MEKTPILAIMYDFDHTLSPRDMQEYGFIPDLAWRRTRSGTSASRP